MPDETERDALSKIKAYLDAGHSIDAIRQTGWASWIDHLEAHGYDVRTGQLSLRPPGEDPRAATQSASKVSVASGPKVSICATCGSYRVGHRTFCKKCQTKWPDEALTNPTSVENPLRATDVSVTSGSDVPICAKCGSSRVGNRPLCKVCHTEWPDGTPPGSSPGKPLPMWAWAAGVAVVILLIVVGAVAGDGDQSTSRDASSYTVLEQSAAVFNGGYSEGQIKRELDRAMDMYGLSITESNYDRATNTLVGLRQEYGFSEMDILDYMIRSYVPGLNITFTEMAGLAVVGLLAGDY